MQTENLNTTDGEGTRLIADQSQGKSHNFIVKTVFLSS